MRLLIDTQIVYWFFFESHSLPASARSWMDQAQSVHLSAASIWEIAIKVRIGKMRADPQKVAQNLERAGFLELPISARHTVRVAEMPLHHSDPFDRILLAQAMSEDMRFLTADEQLPQYSELVIQV